MDVFYLRAGGRTLEAWGLEELAELVGLAHQAGDEVAWVRVSTDHQVGLLDDTLFGRLLELLPRAADGGAQKGENR